MVHKQYTARRFLTPQSAFFSPSSPIALAFLMADNLLLISADLMTPFLFGPSYFFRFRGHLSKPFSISNLRMHKSLVS